MEQRLLLRQTFINALELTSRKIEEVKVVFSGAGAAAIACAKLLKRMGVAKQNIMCDSRGVIYKGREEGMNEYKILPVTPNLEL